MYIYIYNEIAHFNLSTLLSNSYHLKACALLTLYKKTQLPFINIMT